MYIFSIILPISLAIQVSASVASSRFIARQSSPQVPTVSACSSACAPYSSALQSCIQAQINQTQTEAANGTVTGTPPNCVCTSPVSSALVGCWNCYASHTGDVTGAQNAVAAVAQICNDPALKDEVTASAGPSGSATVSTGSAAPSGSTTPSSGSTGSKSGAVSLNLSAAQAVVGTMLLTFTLVLV